MRKSIISLALALGLAFPAFSDELTIKPDAPSRYTVVSGDTLWGISGRYLQSPWRWPELWRMNQNQVRNPHWIYPGDALQLDYVNGQPRLSLASDAMREVKLSPQARPEDLDQAISSIPADAIEPFLARPLIVDPQQFAAAPRLIAGPDERISISQGDRVYASGIGETGSWQAYRLGQQLQDPDSKEPLGVEAVYGGDLVVDKLKPDIQTLQVRNVAGEVLVGDYLVRAPKSSFINYAPHPAPDHLQGKIISIYQGIGAAAQYSTVALNLGARNGVEPGLVFGIFKKGGAIEVTDAHGKKKQAQLPTEQAGQLFVYRVFDKVSYALVLNSLGAIYVNDLIATPQNE
ncbi:LysM peptidoglycan-binding domain-containing protein [Chromobacterium sp. IIBBL 290-4]|uniref:LysM peptidoglycan-binding domain-containing protein n=1 Tax=Chromobacterium sp. IIBBL 290-4 TaxID=2953890 RepID=UPI0020B71F5B|nr:LysM domain-containing protein [Chromobacterium sp. IIBBL 290-4]UTH75489.1 LysM peptidoglycan-binding domain-containing protein [Chromobacterium sp. IIBBL 290-4]